LERGAWNRLGIVLDFDASTAEFTLNGKPIDQLGDSVWASTVKEAGRVDGMSIGILGPGNDAAILDNIRIAAVIPACYANCDESTTPPAVNVLDFLCFVNAFSNALSLPPAAQITDYANCDGSVTEPVLNVKDFSCFLDRYAAGCM
jgi:hypothetical protein